MIKQEQYNDRAGVNDDLDGRQEEGVQQHEQSGHGYDRQHQKHRAGDRITTERIGDDQ